jgi:hypothetical protein
MAGLAVLVALTGLAACGGTMATSAAGAIGEGTRIRLAQDLRFEPRIVESLRPALWFQDGRILRQAMVDRFNPYCSFSPPKVSSGDQLVTADVFVVVSVLRETEMSGLPESSRKVQKGGLVRVGDTPGLTLTSLRLDLRAARQGAGFSLTCARRGERGEPPIGPADLRQSLGSYFELLQPASASGSA